MSEGRRLFLGFGCKRGLQHRERCLRIVDIAEQLEIFGADHFVTDQRIEVDDLFPVFRTIKKNRNPTIKLSGLLQGQDLSELVEGPEAAREHHQGARQMREPKLAHEKIMELEGQTMSD